MIWPISHAIRILFLLLTVWMGGCAEHPATRFHILTTTELPADYQAPGFGGKIKRIGIRRIKLPGYLDRPQIITRSGKNELMLSATHQWAEPLSQSMQRVLTGQLTVLLPDVSVSAFPWPGSAKQDVEIQVEINQFDIIDKQNCLLDAKWTLFDSGERQPRVRRTTILIPVQANNFSNYVSMQSEALARLSEHIVSSLTD